MSKNLLIRFLLPSLEDLVIEKLLSELVFRCNVNDEFRIYNNCPKNQHSGILINK